MAIQPVILAAGKGTRMGSSELPKVMIPVKGKPMLSYLLDSLSHTELLPPVLVVGFRSEVVKDYFPKYQTILQQEQLGTGHAMLICEEELKGKSQGYLVLAGDQPLWKPSTLTELVRQHTEALADITVGTLTTDQSGFTDFGRIIRNASGEVEAIREYKDCTEEERLINEYNLTLYCFDDCFIWPALHQIKSGNTQGEYYITDVLAMALAENKKVHTYRVEDWQETLGINTPEQLQTIESLL